MIGALAVLGCANLFDAGPQLDVSLLVRSGTVPLTVRADVNGRVIEISASPNTTSTPSTASNRGPGYGMLPVTVTLMRR